jgi:hypothetical protein
MILPSGRTCKGTNDFYELIFDISVLPDAHTERVGLMSVFCSVARHGRASMAMSESG